MVIKKSSLFALLTLLILPLSLFSQNTPEHNIIISVERIWDRAGHNAFTTLLDYNNMLYCAFREGEGHVSDVNGTIRVIASADGQNWHSVAHLYERGVDLRDPQLSITPDNRIMLNMGGSVYIGGKLTKMQPKVSFSDKNGQNFSTPGNVFIDEAIRSGKDWLWRATWHKGVAYATIYQPAKEKPVQLLRSGDGIRYKFMTTFDIFGGNETTLRFTDDNEMVAVVRRGKGNNHGYIGSSRAPYKKWNWHELGVRLGGPDLLIMPDGRMICGTREYPADRKEKMILAHITKDGQFTKMVTLPSGGDCSYPGLVLRDSILYVSYYSSHENQTAIYLARLFDLKYAYEYETPSPAPAVVQDREGVVKIKCSDAEAEIRYTVDGSMPSQTRGYIYHDEILVERTTQLRMLSWLPGRPVSELISQTIGTDILQAAEKEDLKTVQGLSYRYYHGVFSRTGEIETVSVKEQGIVSKISLSKQHRPDNFAFIFQGYVRIPEDGLYRFYLESNDGSRMSMDGSDLIVNDGLHGAVEYSALTTLQKGLHRISIRYFQAGGGQKLKLSWEGPGFVKTEVPAGVLSH